MRKLFTFLVAFLATVSGAVWGQYTAEIDINNPSGDYYSGRYNRIVLPGSNNAHYRIYGNGSESSTRVRINGDCTITLDNVNILRESNSLTFNDLGRPFQLAENINVTLIIKGENSIESVKGSLPTDYVREGIFVPQNSTLTISKESDGRLYAKGCVGIGSVERFGSIPTGGAGPINIYGGTVIAEGTEAAFGGHDEANNITIDGNTFVVAKGATTGIKPNRAKGILYNTTDKVNYPNGPKVYGDVVLSSPAWLDDEHNFGYDKLDFEQNATLTLGSGVFIPKEKVAGNEGKIRAYQMNYDANYFGGATEQQSINYFGPNCTVTGIKDLECKEDPVQHQFLGWMSEDGTIHTNQTYTTPDPVGGGNLTKLDTLTLKGAWINTNRTISITPSGFSETELFLSPTNAKVKFEVQSGSSLPAGMQLDGRQLGGTYNTTSDHTTIFDVKINDTEEVRKNLIVTFDYAINITIKSASVVNKSYTSNAIEDAIKVVAVDENETPIPVTLGKHYTIASYDYKPVDQNAGNRNPDNTTIQEAGTYTNIKIATKGNDVAFVGGYKGEVGGELQITPYPIYVVPTTKSAVEGTTINITYELQPNPTPAGKTPKTNDGKLGLETENPGQENNITIGTLALVDDERNKFYKNNYTLDESRLGTFFIKEDIGKDAGEYNIVLSKSKWTYDGMEYNAKDIVTLKKGLETIGNENYSVIFIKNNKPSALKNAGTYTVKVNGENNLGGTLVLTDAITIDKASINAIGAKPQSIKIGEQPNLSISDETVTIEDLVGAEFPTVESKLSLKDGIDINVKGNHTGALIVPKELELKDNIATGFYRSNYGELPSSFTAGTLTVTDDSGIDIDIPEEGEIEVDENGNVSFPYDGKNHNNFFTDKKITVKYTEDEKEKTLELGINNYQVTWKKDNSEWTSTEEPWNVGTYVATITVTKEDPAAIKGKSTVRTITVTKRSLSATIKPQTIETADASIKTEVNGNVTIVNPVKTETAVLTGSLKVKDGLTLQAGHIYKGAIVKDNFTLTDGTDQNGFKAANYELNDENITAGDLTVKQATDPGDIIPGDGDKDWTWNPTQNAYTMIYDGLEHGITQLKVKFTDNENNVSYQVVKVTATYQPNVTPKEYVDGGYTATVSIPENEYIKNGTASLKLMILKRDMTLDLHLPQSLTEGGTPNWNAKTAITFTNLANPKGKEETPTIKDECRLVIENGKAVLKGYPYIEDNAATGFKMNNYTVDYKNNGQDITINPDGDGDVEIPEIPVNPDEGGDGGDGQDPTKYYNIYDVTEYDFIDVSFSRHVVREGGSVNVYLGIPEGLDPAAVTLMFKRSLYGGWENLNTDDDGNYLINNIWTDIYVKAVVDESYIDPNPDENHIYIDLSETNDSIWLYTERKLVEEGKTAVIQAEVAKSCQNKEIRYMYKRTVLGEWKEMPKDYSINQYVVRDITTDIYVKAYFVFDKQDPTTAKNPHHVYADITATCEGLYLDATRHKVADEGDTKVFLYVKKGFETKDARYLFKRGLKGEWEDLVPGIEQNTFQVTDIEGDIYLKGIDAVYTGTEDIDGMVRVYTKDGSLFVYTAQPEEISVVSMTGVAVKRTRQTGLQSYPLNQGIYVVCVGEQVFKVRVK